MTRYYLVVDDDEVCRKLLHQYLRQLLGSPSQEGSSSFVIHSAKDGIEALTYAVQLRPLRYDLVITDFSMPGVNGAETAKLLRVIDERSTIACVTSDRLDMSFLTVCKVSGIYGAWSKPIDGDKMLSILLTSIIQKDTMEKGGSHELEVLVDHLASPACALKTLSERTAPMTI